MKVKMIRECARCRKPLPIRTPRSPVEINDSLFCGECFFDDKKFGLAFKKFREISSSSDTFLIKRVVQ